MTPIISVLNKIQALDMQSDERGYTFDGKEREDEWNKKVRGDKLKKNKAMTERKRWRRQVEEKRRQGDRKKKGDE